MALFSFIFGDSKDDSGMSETKSFRIKYDGEALAGHAIDVNDLAPALLSLGDLMHEANRIANRDDSNISIKVKATETGCFQISIQAIQTLAAGAESFLTGPPITALVNLLSILGFIGVTGGTVFVVIKKLKNRRPKIVSETTTTIEIDTGEGIVSISKLEWEMIQSKKLRQSIYGLLKPLERPGIENVDFIDVESNTITTSVKKSEVGFFIPAPDPLEPLPDIPPRETYVNVVHMWYREGNKWKFSEGGNEWSAEVKDNKFIEKLLKGESVVAANDFLKVRVRQTQFRQGSVIQSEFEILEVLEHKKGYEQMRLT